MVATKINKLLAYSTIITSLSFSVCAKEIGTNTAQLQAMDKITGRVNVIKAPVNSEVKFGSFSIIVRDCKTRPPEETPENFAFIDVAEYDDNTQTLLNIFKGWMISSSPSLNAVEHPIYDIWLLKCIDTDITEAKILTGEELRERDDLPKIRDEKKDNKKELDDLENILEVNEKIEEEQQNLDLEPVPEEASIESAETQEPAEEGTAPIIVIEEEEEGQGPRSLLNFESKASPNPDAAPLNSNSVFSPETSLSIEDYELREKEEQAAKALEQIEEAEHIEINNNIIENEETTPQSDTSSDEAPLLSPSINDSLSTYDNEILELLNKQ